MALIPMKTLKKRKLSSKNIIRFSAMLFLSYFYQSDKDLEAQRIEADNICKVQI